MDIGSKEWRDQLAIAVGFRMHAMDKSLPPDEATRRVRDFMKRGPSSEFAGPVMAAAFEMFSPAFTAFAPIIRMAVSAINSIVQAENKNGSAIQDLLSAEEG